MMVNNDNYKIRASYAYQKWKSNIPHPYRCYLCGVSPFTQFEHVTLYTHHIKSFINYPNLRFEPLNGVYLCFDCHHKVHALGGEHLLDSLIKELENHDKA